MIEVEPRRASLGALPCWAFGTPANERSVSDLAARLKLGKAAIDKL
jgi:hypothetical protein